MPTTIDTSQRSPTLRVFLAHASADKTETRDIAKRLSAEGFEPWLDEEQLLPGSEWSREVDRAVRSSDVILVLLSHNSVQKSGYANVRSG